MDERILGLARLLIVPGGIPEKAVPDAVHSAAAAGRRVRVLADLDLPAYRECPDSAGSGKDFWRIMATRKRPSAPRKSLCEQKPWEDEVLREVYAARDAYAAEHGYDLDRIYADLKRREASSRLRRVKAARWPGRSVELA